MSQEVNIAKIYAEVGGQNVSAEGLRVVQAINSAPIVTMTVGRKSDKIVQSPLSEEVVATLRERQTARLAGRPKPDISVSAQDGNDGTLEFSGYLTAPVVEISRHSVADQLTIMGVDGALDGLDLGIYRLSSWVPRAENSDDGQGVDFPQIPTAKDGNVIGTLTSLTDLLLQSYESAIKVEFDPSEQELIRNQHKINMQAPIEVWRAILSNSDVTYDSWAKAFALNQYYPQRMAQSMYEMLTTKSGGFWGTLNSLMAGFQMFYVPSLAGSGKLLRNDSKVLEVDGELNLSVTMCTLSDGSHRLLPIGGVVMEMPGSQTDRPETSDNKKAVAAQYPDNLLSGFIHREMPPPWLVGTDGLPVFGSEIGKGDRTGGVDLSLNNLLKRRSSLAQYYAQTGAASSGVMTELCKVAFLEMQLAHSTASITTNLDFTIPIGVRKKINILGGGSFEGFITSVNHTVDLHEGKQLNSSTTIELSHIKY